MFLFKYTRLFSTVTAFDLIISKVYLSSSFLCVQVIYIGKYSAAVREQSRSVIWQEVQTATLPVIHPELRKMSAIILFHSASGRMRRRKEMADIKKIRLN